MDAAAVSLCMENDLPIVVFDLNQPDNIVRVVQGERVGTIISGGAGPMSAEVISAIEGKMGRAVESMERDFQGLRTGRASTSLVERLVVEYYGTPTPLNQIAGISVPGGPPDRHPAVGPERPRGDREGDPEERHRADPERRRLGRPAQHPAAHRGAPARHRQGRPPADGRGQGRDPQPSPRGRRHAQEGRAGRQPRAATPPTASSTSSRRSPTGSSPRSTAWALTRSTR